MTGYSMLAPWRGQGNQDPGMYPREGKNYAGWLRNVPVNHVECVPDRRHSPASHE